jgi:ketosteroid isomerase-like protein
VSQENVEIVRRSWKAFAIQGPEAVLPFLHPEVVLVDPDLPGGGTFEGHDGFLTFVRQVLDAFDDYRVEPEEFLDAGGERVVVFLRHQARGKQSGTPIELRDAHVWTIEDGKTIRIDLYLDRDKALEAAGLRE